MDQTNKNIIYSSIQNTNIPYSIKREELYKQFEFLLKKPKMYYQFYKKYHNKKVNFFWDYDKKYHRAHIDVYNNKIIFETEEFTDIIVDKPTKRRFNLLENCIK